MSDSHHNTSSYRATVAGRQLILHDRDRGMASDGPVGNLFRDRSAAGISIVDLDIECDGDRTESVVTYLTHGDRIDADHVLIDWARTTGQRRIWLQDRVVDLQGDALAVGPAAGTCTCCAMRWEEHSLAFWETVRHLGRFPMFCPLCGGTLAQWEVEEEDEPQLTVRPREAVLADE